jgi:hypothetical protein
MPSSIFCERGKVFQEGVQSGLFLRLWQVRLEDYAREVGIKGNWLSMDETMVKASGGKSNGSESHGPRQVWHQTESVSRGSGHAFSYRDGANRHDMKLTEMTLEAQQIVPGDLEPGEHRHLCLERYYSCFHQSHA